jgi:hypothetical protein
MMKNRKLKIIRRRKGGQSSNPTKEKPSKESWEKLKEIALQKGWIKKP